MIDNTIEANLRAVKSFREFWSKFHSIYSEIISRERIGDEEETKFLDAKGPLRSKYEELLKSLDFKYMPHSRLTDPVESILNISTIRFSAEKNRQKIEEDWRDSYIFLNSIEEHLKNRKRRLEHINPVLAVIKKIFRK